MADLKHTPPLIKKLSGSYFPKLQRTGSYGYTVETVDGQPIYYGYSEPVARLLVACLTPRAC
jgi:hypothetical protein